jgi:hypothetical protein
VTSRNLPRSFKPGRPYSSGLPARRLRGNLGAKRHDVTAEDSACQPKQASSRVQAELLQGGPNSFANQDFRQFCRTNRNTTYLRGTRYRAIYEIASSCMSPPRALGLQWIGPGQDRHNRPSRDWPTGARPLGRLVRIGEQSQSRVFTFTFRCMAYRVSLYRVQSHRQTPY